MLQGFPKTRSIRDGRTVVIRLLTGGDASKLHAMFMTLKPDSRRFLYDDVTNPKIVESWTRNIRYKEVLPLVAELDGEIVADGTLHRRSSGPLRHVGRVRVVVSEHYQGLGVGTILMKELIEVARREGLKMLSSTQAEYEQAPAIQTLKALGFRRCALIPNYMMDPDGGTHAMAILIKELT